MEKFENFPCIKKFYNSTIGEYYDIENKNFHWPYISHGLSNQKTAYSIIIIIEKCKQESLDEALGKGKYKCKSDEEIKNLFLDGHNAIHYFLDQDVDVLNYQEPDKKYIYNTENSWDINNFSINHVNIDLIIIFTHDGIVFGNTKVTR